jgi:hypothetical protein
MGRARLHSLSARRADVKEWIARHMRRRRGKSASIVLPTGTDNGALELVVIPTERLPALTCALPQSKL